MYQTRLCFRASLISLSIIPVTGPFSEWCLRDTTYRVTKTGSAPRGAFSFVRNSTHRTANTPLLPLASSSSPDQLGRTSARTHSVHTSPPIWWTIQAAVLLEPCAAIFSQHVAPHPEVGTAADPGTDPLVLAGGAAPPAAAFFCFLAADAWHMCSDCTERENGIEAHDTGNRESPYGPWPPYPQCRCLSTFLSGSEFLIRFARK